MLVKRTERGWVGHYICSDRCLFRRNTLLEYNDIKIVISTVGLLKLDGNIETIGSNRYFETMAFHSNKNDTRYNDADIRKQISFNSNWCINKENADDEANDMHEKVVEEITNELLKGNNYAII